MEEEVPQTGLSASTIVVIELFVILIKSEVLQFALYIVHRKVFKPNLRFDTFV